MKDFALIGAAGFVARRHFEAIKQTGNRLVAALDKSDSVGVLDQYFPEANFFVEHERFDRYIAKLSQTHQPVDFLSICSPNYLHDSHIRFGLKHGADIICEKPLVLNPRNIEGLEKLEADTGKRIYNILQLRLHPDIIGLRDRINKESHDKIFNVDLTYITSRGHWYYTSWKSDPEKSGGIATNIGIHFFDMLIWIFGKVKSSTVHSHSHDRAAGVLELERARVRWFVSINSKHLPPSPTERNGFRALTVDGVEFEFSGGFDNLHTRSYEEIIAGYGFSIGDVRPSIELAHQIRTADLTALKNDYHPYAKLPLMKHPFEE